MVGSVWGNLEETHGLEGDRGETKEGTKHWSVRLKMCTLPHIRVLGNIILVVLDSSCQ